MFTLCEDNFNTIISFLSPSSIYSLSRSCKSFVKFTKDLNKLEIKKDIFRCDYIPLVKYFVNMGTLTSKDFYLSIESCSLNIVKYFFRDTSNKNICRYIINAKHMKYKTCAESAAKSNSLPMIKYIIECGFKTSKNTLNIAVKNKNLEMIKFLISLKCNLDFDTIELAISTYNFNIFELIENYYASRHIYDIDQIIRSACKCGNLPVIQHYESKGVPFNDYTYYSIQSGDLETFKFFITRSIYTDIDGILIHAIYMGKINIADWLIKNNYCCIPNNCVKEIIRRTENSRTVIEWLKQIGYNFTEEELNIIKIKF
jgi:hypothetical protein